MSTPTTPYTPDLAGREPLQAMRDTAARIAGIVATWTPAQFERSYAPGKWSARLILIHLAQAELALGYRARMALTVRTTRRSRSIRTTGSRRNMT